MCDDGFYEGWGDDYERGYDMTEEEWEELHTPVSSYDAWDYD